VNAGAGEGNRTLVCSLGSCRSTIELRPQINDLAYIRWKSCCVSCCTVPTPRDLFIDSSSAVRQGVEAGARPCQGRGRGFESLRPLQYLTDIATVGDCCGGNTWGNSGLGPLSGRGQRTPTTRCFRFLRERRRRRAVGFLRSGTACADRQLFHDVRNLRRTIATRRGSQVRSLSCPPPSLPEPRKLSLIEKRPFLRGSCRLFQRSRSLPTFNCLLGGFLAFSLRSQKFRSPRPGLGAELTSPGQQEFDSLLGATPIFHCLVTCLGQSQFDSARAVEASINGLLIYRKTKTDLY
jgi:hypothetical protein